MRAVDGVSLAYYLSSATLHDGSHGLLNPFPSLQSRVFMGIAKLEKRIAIILVLYFVCCNEIATLSYLSTL